jgi:hypothetical protein
MPDIRISELPLATGPTAPVGTDVVAIDNGSTRKATLSSLAPVIRPFASQAEAEAGADNTKTMTPLTTAQAMAAVSATVAQGAKADTAMQPTIYDPNSVAKDAFSVSNSNIAVTRYGASTSNTSAQNETAFNAAEVASAGSPIYVPSGTYQLQLPSNRSYTARYYGPGILRFDNAQWTRRGGSSGSPSVPERYTLFFEYENQSDVSLKYAGVAQSFTWVTPYTLEASGASTTSDLVEINIANGKRRLGLVPQTIFSFNTLDSQAPNLAPDHRSPPNAPVGYNNAFLGVQTPIELTTGSNNTAVGSRAARSLTTAGNTTAIGFQALYRATGSGNTAVGSVAGEWVVDGDENTLMGLSAGSHITSGDGNTALGYHALGDDKTGSYTTAVGYRAFGNTGQDNPLSGCTAIGAFSGDQAYGTRNTLVGYRTGGGAVGAGSSGSYNTAVGWFALRNHDGANYNVAVGDSALVSVTTGSNNVGVGFESLSSITTVGSLTAVGSGSLKSNTSGSENVAVGSDALATLTTATGNTAVGFLALSASNSASNVGVGTRAGNALTTGQFLTAAGYEAGRFISTADHGTFFGFRAGRASTAADNTAVGSDALLFNTTGIQNTALGRAALRVDQAAANQTTYSNTTGVGYLASVSGSNQVQLGNSSTTTYVYGTVQNRSDARDKADIRDTELGLDFIMSLRPVDYRWDMREDYISFNEATGKVKRKKKDGSKKRTRFHHGFIAQELAECGFDFGGLQDHSKAGGADVMTVGYDEMIAPLVKAVQELTKRIKELEGK